MPFDKKAHRKKYYHEHREEAIEYSKRFYWDDPEKARKIAKLYRLNNPEKCRETKRKHDLKHKKEIQEYNGNYYREHKDKIIIRTMRNHRKRIYNISPEDLNLLIKNQGNKCGICKKEFIGKKPYVPYIDHSHKTGKIRGLLCGKCNFAIGMLKESESIMKNAIKWIEERS
jgi:hypothetical protein